VDINVCRKGEDRPFAYVQCKAWHLYKVGIKSVRELFGTMAIDGIRTGYFFTTGEYTAEAYELVRGKEMELVTGNMLLAKLNELSETDRIELLVHATQDDYTTPTCPQCDIKMVRRIGSTGEFWGCPNYSRRPSCRQTFKLRATI
jgi:restriction system protein